MVPNKIECGKYFVRFCSDGRAVVWYTGSGEHEGKQTWLSRDYANVFRARLAMDWDNRAHLIYRVWWHGDDEFKPLLRQGGSKQRKEK